MTLDTFMLWFFRIFGYSMFMVVGWALCSDKNIWNVIIGVIGAVVLGHMAIRDSYRIEREELT